MDVAGNRCAVITGASAGIGLAFAKEFARNGFNIVLVARRQEKLLSIAKELENSFNIGVLPLPVDLSQTNSSETITVLLAEKSIKVDALVNNAGFGINQGFLEANWSTHEATLAVMLTGYTRLCYLLAKGMKERHYGRIINIASLAAFLPATSGSLYTAIKSYVLNFTTALDLELRPFGIHCTAVCPGFTMSEFHDVMKVRKSVSRYPGLMWMSADTVARQGYAAVMKGKPIVINGWLNKLVALAFNLLPRAFLHRRQRNVKPWPID